MLKVLRTAKTWADFRAALAPLGNTEKGQCFELLTKYYLELDPRYATHLKHVWLLREVPARVRRRLNLPSSDEGIDLIAETYDGEYWAIQCKYTTDETKPVTRRQLATFTDLAFNICGGISQGLVCTNGERPGHKLRLYGDRLTFITGDTWRDLDDDFFRRLRSLVAGRSAPLKPFKRRKHQRDAVKNAHRHFVEEGNSRGKLIHPCGTGKSLIGYWIAEKLDAKTVVVAVPSLALIKQSLEVWAREAVANAQPVRWICVCSDETVRDIPRDDVAVLTQDLGVDVHTDPSEIATWLRKRHQGLKVIFATYQSGRALAEAARTAGRKIDLAILDEAHKTVGKKDSLFSHLLYDGNIPIRKRVFMTATERRYAGRGDQIVSMDDPELYGDTFDLMTFKAAMETEPPILSDYQIVTICVTRDEVAELIDENLYVKPDKGKWDKEVEAQMLAAAISLRKAIQSRPIKHAVSFHSTIARAKAFQQTQDTLTEALGHYKKLETFHVTGAMSTTARDDQIDEFSSARRALITNARCLTEGVDVPNIDCVLFADPKRSTVDIVQAVGRALRRAEGKKRGYVVIPILMDQELTEGATNDTGAFDTVLTVLQALAANDERIVEYFRTISHGRRRNRHNDVFQIDVPAAIVIDTDTFSEAVQLKFWSKLAKLSWRPFEEARAFARSLGLTSRGEWKQYCRGKLKGKAPKPEDIPTGPNRVYKDTGWSGWGDWLGTGTVAPSLRVYRPFEEARAFVHGLKLASGNQWNKYCRGELEGKPPKPDDIPTDAAQTYKDTGWAGMGDWLGTGRVATHQRVYRPFEEARAFVHGLKLASGNQWNKYCRGELEGKPPKPDDIPASPVQTYKDAGWAGMGDWLGTGRLATHQRVYRPFEEARDFVHRLKLANGNEWRRYCRGELKGKPPKPDDIPNEPGYVYKDAGWAGMGDWLGTGRLATHQRVYRPFTVARAFARSLNLKSGDEWKQYYRGELKGKPPMPEDIPSSPSRVYKDTGWVGWGDWLGTGTIAPQDRVFLSFGQACDFARSLGLTSGEEWRKYCRGELEDKPPKPDDIPNDPRNTYKDRGWSGWGDWLGTGRIAYRSRVYLPFEEARAFARSLGLTSGDEWRKYCRGELEDKPPKPDDIPTGAPQTYKDRGWAGWGDWLGTGTIAPRLRVYRAFVEARAFARGLGLANWDEWRKYCRGELKNKPPKPDDIPTNPRQTYKADGWVGMGDWLGTGRIANQSRVFLPFKKARAFVRGLKLANRPEWRKYCRGELKGKPPKPDDIPNDPGKTYKDAGWSDMGDWLGTGNKWRGRTKKTKDESAD